MTIKLIEGSAALLKFIDNIAGRAKKLDGDIHIGAVSAAAHFMQHGDVTYINRLYNAMGKGARHVAMTAWLLQYAGVQANDDKASKANLPFIKDGSKDGSKTVDLVGGTKTPWFTMKPPKNPDVVIDLLKLTLAVIKKASRPDAQVAHGDMLTELQALAEKFAPVDEVEEATEDGEAIEG